MPKRPFSQNLFKLKLKPYGYLFFLVPPLVLLLSYFLGQEFHLPNFFAFFTLFFTFVLIPLLDWSLGEDQTNPEEQEEEALLEKNFYYALLPLSALPILMFILIWGAFVFTAGHLNGLGQLGWVLSVGVVSSILGINVAHELVHKTSRIEQWSGGVLLSLVTYGGFKVEHIRGHHVHVSTPRDASSSRYNQSLYHFLPRALYSNMKSAWQLEAERLKRRDKSVLHFSNELFWWYGLSFLWAMLFTLQFGQMGLIYFFGQSVVAFILLEIINYLEHYGLHRRSLENGRYEAPTVMHSWNSNYFLTNLLLFQLQRHSDHHAHPRRRYQVLRQFQESPQLPAGYPTMVLLALCPPLWRRVMNPKVEAYYQEK